MIAMIIICWSLVLEKNKKGKRKGLSESKDAKKKRMVF
jgi:hypothetical protein